jgi:hypothetical protein
MQEKAVMEAITVNSSPYAVPVYEKLGFWRMGTEEIKNGIRCVPLRLNMRSVERRALFHEKFGFRK